jgi:integrase
VSPGLRHRRATNGTAQYAAYYRDRDTGKQVQTALRASNLTEARRAQRDLLADLDAGRKVTPSSRTVATVADELIEQTRSLVDAGKKKPRTLETLEGNLKHVRASLGRRKVQDVTPDTVVRFIAAHPRNAYAALRQLLNFAVRRGYIVSNPCLALTRDERPSVKPAERNLYGAEEIGRLFAELPEPYATLVKVCAMAGLRQSEALGLRWDDVDFGECVLRLRAQLRRDKAGALDALKTGQTRTVLMDDRLAEALRAHLRRSNRLGGFVFATRSGTAISQRNAARAVSDACEALGIEWRGFHILRHGYATWLITECGANVGHVAAQLGHSDVSTTLRTYTHALASAEHDAEMRRRMGASATMG